MKLIRSGRPGKGRARRRVRGFSLAEIALAFLVVIIFLGGVLVPLSSYLQNARLADNQRTIELIRDRLVEFLAQNGRLPCPARPDLTTGATLGREWVAAEGGRQVCDGSGVAYPGNGTAAVSGVVPWVTLKVPETDPWGRRFTYSVDRSWAEIDPDCNPVGTRAKPGCTRVEAGRPSIVIAQRTAPGVSQVSSDRLAAVVVSHGPNGRGGYLSTGVPAPLAITGSDEEANQLSMPTATTVTRMQFFRTRSPTPESSGCEDSTLAGPFCGFDDQLMALPQSALAPRLVENGHIQ